MEKKYTDKEEQHIREAVDLLSDFYNFPSALKEEIKDPDFEKSMAFFRAAVCGVPVEEIIDMKKIGFTAQQSLSRIKEYLANSVKEKDELYTQASELLGKAGELYKVISKNNISGNQKQSEELEETNKIAEELRKTVRDLQDNNTVLSKKLEKSEAALQQSVLFIREHYKVSSDIDSSAMVRSREEEISNRPHIVSFLFGKNRSHKVSKMDSRKKAVDFQELKEKFLESEEYSFEQKEFFVSCFSEGIPLSEIKAFASPKLTVEQMRYIAQIIGK